MPSIRCGQCGLDISIFKCLCYKYACADCGASATVVLSGPTDAIAVCDKCLVERKKTKMKIDYESGSMFGDMKVDETFSWSGSIYVKCDPNVLWNGCAMAGETKYNCFNLRTNRLGAFKYDTPVQKVKCTLKVSTIIG